MTWKRDVLAARMVAWIRTMNGWPPRPIPAFPARFVFSLGRQRVHLRRVARRGMVGHEAVSVYKAR